MNDFPLPYIGFAAYSGTGKTTLLCKLIPLLKERGIRLAVVKHAHHDFDIDHPKKDSYELRKSGADTILIASRKRTAIIIEHAEAQQEPSLEETLAQVPLKGLDLLLVEGFKHANFPKIELHRGELNKPYMYPTDSNIIAIAADHNINPSDNKLPPHQFDLNQPQHIADFIVTNIIQQQTQ